MKQKTYTVLSENRGVNIADISSRPLTTGLVSQTCKGLPSNSVDVERETGDGERVTEGESPEPLASSASRSSSRSDAGMRITSTSSLKETRPSSNSFVGCGGGSGFGDGGGSGFGDGDG